MNRLLTSSNLLKYVGSWKFNSRSNGSNGKVSEIKVKGKIYDTKPFKMLCEKGKTYMWCACGRSGNQPFCDKSHQNPELGPPSPLKPVKFIAPESTDYFFCNCKQTDNRPLCDGTHKKPEIQAAKTSK